MKINEVIKQKRCVQILHCLRLETNSCMLHNIFCYLSFLNMLQKFVVKNTCFSEELSSTSVVLN